MIDASFWTAVGALGGVALLGFTLVRHMTDAAEQRGHMKARLEALEKAADRTGETERLLPKLEATLEALTLTVSKVDQTMDKLLRGEIELPRSRTSRARAG